MPLRLKTDCDCEATINYNSTHGWVVTFKSYCVLLSVYKTHFGVPLWRHNFVSPVEIVPGQQVSFDVDGNLIKNVSRV